MRLDDIATPSRENIYSFLLQVMDRKILVRFAEPANSRADLYRVPVRVKENLDPDTEAVEYRVPGVGFEFLQICFFSSNFVTPVADVPVVLLIHATCYQSFVAAAVINCVI